MLKWLADPDSPLRVFESITFRSALALGIGFILALVSGQFFIAALHHFRVHEDVEKRDSMVLHRLHAVKRETPTMGGVIIVLSVLATSVLCADLSNVYVHMALFTMLAFAGVGFIDDFVKLRGLGREKGLGRKSKLAMQFALAFIVCAALHAAADTTNNRAVVTRLLVPGTKMVEFFPDLGRFYFIFFLVTMVGCSNAVNLTDGLDGLAAGCTVMTALTFTVLAYMVGHAEVAEYLRIPHVRYTGELTVFSAAVVGGTLGFLWYNANPARVFMGDTGSLALGAAVAFVALAVKQEAVLLVAGGVFVWEALSVILQIGSCKVRGKRVFRCAPFHHHLEYVGWKENHIVVRLWCISAVLAAMGLATLKMH